MGVRAPVAPIEAETQASVELGRFKKARRAYGFDDVALVPGGITINPLEVDISVSFGPLRLAIPIFAAAMDGVVDVAFATQVGRLRGLRVLILVGLQTGGEVAFGGGRGVADGA